MKEIYEKPQFKVERFAVSQNVALTCSGYNTGSGSPNHANRDTCGWDDGWGDIYWLNGNSNCTNQVGEEFTTGEVCYNNPGGNLTIFAS